MSKRTQQHINDLIDRYGHNLSTSRLTDAELGILADSLFQDDDRDLCSLYENQNREMIELAMSNMAVDDSITNQMTLAQTIRQCMISYYRDRIQELIEDTLAERNADDLYHSGYIPARDAQTGERIWSRT